MTRPPSPVGWPWASRSGRRCGRSATSRWRSIPPGCSARLPGPGAVEEHPGRAAGAHRAARAARRAAARDRDVVARRHRCARGGGDRAPEAAGQRSRDHSRRRRLRRLRDLATRPTDRTAPVTTPARPAMLEPCTANDRPVLHGAVVWTTTAAPGEHRVLPDGCMDLIWAEGALLIAGPDTQAHLAARCGAYTGLRFPPGTAPAVLGLPAHELRDRRVPLAELWHGSGVRRVEDQIAGEPAIPATRSSKSPAPLPRRPATGHRYDGAAHGVAGRAHGRARSRTPSGSARASCTDVRSTRSATARRSWPGSCA